MKISVVCGTRAKNLEMLLKFLKMLDNQTFKDFDINIVCDRKFSKYENEKFLGFFQNKDLEVINHTRFFTNINSEFNPDHNGGASYVRNFGIKQAKGEFIQLFDDDNEVDSSFLGKCLEKWENLTKKTKSDCIILPSLYYRNTNNIQNQGFSYFDYRQSRPILYLLKKKEKSQIQMFSGNGIFSLASTLRKAQYDENIARISEDLDYTLSLYEKGVQLRVFSDLKVKHHERDKNKLEQAWIGSYSQARQKARNRFLFVYKHGNNMQKLQFYLCGLPGCLLWLSLKSLLLGGKESIDIIKGLFIGAKEGWIKVHNKNY